MRVKFEKKEESKKIKTSIGPIPVVRELLLFGY